VVPLSPSSSASTILAAGARILGFYVPDEDADSSLSLPSQFTGYPPFPTITSTHLPAMRFPQPPLGAPSHSAPTSLVGGSMSTAAQVNSGSSATRHSSQRVMSLRSWVVSALQLLRPSVPPNTSLPGYLASYALFCLVPSMLTSLTLMLFSYRECLGSQCLGMWAECQACMVFVAAVVWMAYDSLKPSAVQTLQAASCTICRPARRCSGCRCRGGHGPVHPGGWG
jgi:hypothetical protein